MTRFAQTIDPARGRPMRPLRQRVKSTQAAKISVQTTMGPLVTINGKLKTKARNKRRGYLDVARVTEQFLLAVQAKHAQARASSMRIAPRDTTYLTAANARLAALPADFADWVWDQPDLPDGVPEILGPPG